MRQDLLAGLIFVLLLRRTGADNEDDDLRVRGRREGMGNMLDQITCNHAGLP